MHPAKNIFPTHPSTKGKINAKPLKTRSWTRMGAGPSPKLELNPVLTRNRSPNRWTRNQNPASLGPDPKLEPDRSRMLLTERLAAHATGQKI